MPSTLPPSSTRPYNPQQSSSSEVDPPQQQPPLDGGPSTVEKPRYVVSATGHAAHPDDIVASCRALHEHVSRLQSEAEAELRALDERIRRREMSPEEQLLDLYDDPVTSEGGGKTSVSVSQQQQNQKQPAPKYASALTAGIGALSLDSMMWADNSNSGVAAGFDKGKGVASAGGVGPSHQGFGAGGLSEMAAPEYDRTTPFGSR